MNECTCASCCTQATRETGIEALRALSRGDGRTAGARPADHPRGRVGGRRLRSRNAPWPGSQREPRRLLCQFLDVTDRKRFEAQLQFMADHDPLTGLLNRRKFEPELDRHVEHVKRYGPEGALLVLDLDHFKTVNDTLGHNAGDQLIVSIAA